MPRLGQVGRDDAHPFAQAVYGALFGDRDPVAEPGTATGTPGDWWTVFALVPDAFDHTTAGFQFYRSPDRQLSPRLRELGQLRAGWAVGSRFVFSQHCKAARDVGWTNEQIEAVPHWQVADCFEPLERALLAYADALATAQGRVPEGVFDVLHEHLSDEEILEFTYVTATYVMHATMSRALRLEYDDVDDPVVEIDTPGLGKTGLDVMAMADTPDDTADTPDEPADSPDDTADSPGDTVT